MTNDLKVFAFNVFLSQKHVWLGRNYHYCWYWISSPLVVDEWMIHEVDLKVEYRIHHFNNILMVFLMVSCIMTFFGPWSTFGHVGPKLVSEKCPFLKRPSRPSFMVTFSWASIWKDTWLVKHYLSTVKPHYVCKSSHVKWHISETPKSSTFNSPR